GVVQGLVVGIGFFIFRVPNALLLTLLASLAGIFPIIGTTIVWAPVVIYLFLAGNNFAAIGIIFFGIISSSIDNLIRPIFVSKRTNVHTAVILIGMIGGLFLFGILGFILGPLILSYLLVILELYRTKGEKPIFLSPLPK
ncbi:MAG: AI-2E family transporter, partial [Candidatus Nanoarchaeia archaeon]